MEHSVKISPIYLVLYHYIFVVDANKPYVVGNSCMSMVKGESSCNGLVEAQKLPCKCG